MPDASVVSAEKLLQQPIIQRRSGDKLQLKIGIFCIALISVFLFPAANAISVSCGTGADGGTSGSSASYSLDSSVSLAENIVIDGGSVSTGGFVEGCGNNSLFKTASSQDAVVSSNVSSLGDLVSTSASFAAADSASLGQNVFAAGLSEAGVSGSSDQSSTAQSSGVLNGSMATSQVVSAQESDLRAMQSSSIGASLGYINGEAQANNNTIKVTGGLNGEGGINGFIASSAADNASAAGSFEAASLESKAYTAAKATSTEADAYSYLSSNESLASNVLASAAGHVDASQDMAAVGSSLIYSSTSNNEGSKDYSAKSDKAVSGSISANSGSPQAIDTDLDGDVMSSVSEVSPMPGSWVWTSLTGYVNSNPFPLRDSLGQRHIFAKGTDNGLWDNRDGDWLGISGTTGPKIASDPYAVNDDKGKVHVFAKGTDNALKDAVLNVRKKTTSWLNLGGTVASDPTAVLVPGQSNVKAFYRGTNNALYSSTVNTGTLTAAAPTSMGGNIQSNPNAIADSTGKVHVFVRNADNTVSDNAGGTWRSLGTQKVSSDARPAVSPSAPGTVYVYARGTDGTLVRNTLTSSATAWAGLGGGISGKASGSIYNGNPSPVYSSNDKQIHTYVRGTNGALMENVNGAWKSLGGSITSDPRAIDSDGLLEVAARGSNGALTIAQPQVYGSWPNPLGNPIGGGAGYKKVVLRSEANYVVSDKAGLLSALSRATAGQVIYIDDNAKIDLTGSKNIKIPAGVTLASGRGNGASQGALLYITSASGQTLTESSALFWANGANVRVSGIRLQGPTGATSTTLAARGIWSKYPGFTVDDCEIFNFPHAAIVVAGGASSSKINFNYLHHNQRSGWGYGVVQGAGNAFATIQGNLFDYNRHHISSGGDAGNSYVAQYNTALEHDNVGHNFDVHGGVDRGDGTNIAGKYFKIDHNTFKSTYYRNIILRGIPTQGAWMNNNWFYNSNTAWPIMQKNAWGKFYPTNNLFGTGSSAVVSNNYYKST